jgi:Apea-like HEPN
MAISVEYLAIFRRTDSFCDSAASFTRLLQVDSNIVVSSGAIRFQGQPTCNFQISGGEVAAKKQRYFHLRFTWDGDPVADPADLERFISLLKAVRGAIAQADGEAETLWDEVSGYYARTTYPLIHDIENSMRRLIANFMLVNVGLEWASESLPSGVEEAVRKSKRKGDGEDPGTKSKGGDYLNVLHTLDFIHLGEILFNPYSKKTPQDLYARLKDVKTLEEVAALKDFIPQSNWRRYFQKLVDCEDSYLETRWKKLYDLRCKVAHNAIMTGRDLDDTRKLIDEVRPKLLDAIGKLSNVTVPPDEAELVAENAARTVNAAVGEFISCWQQLESALARLAPNGDGRPRPTIRVIGELVRLGILDLFQIPIEQIHSLRDLRNQLVHGPASVVPIERIQRAAEELRAILTAIEGGDCVQRLSALQPIQLKEEIERRAEETSHEILETEEFASAMATTNASGFGIDDLEVGTIDLSSGECVAKITYSASGDHDEEKMFSGNRVTGSAELVIGPAGTVSYRYITAEVDHGGDEAHDEAPEEVAST